MRASKSRKVRRKTTGGIEDVAMSGGEEDMNVLERTDTMSFVPPEELSAVRGSKVISMFFIYFDCLYLYD